MTKKLYLSDSYLYECSAKITSVKILEIGMVVLFDQTVFYPKGGGQACDEGKIFVSGVSCAVKNIFLDEDGKVCHLLSEEIPNLKIGDVTVLKINKKIRLAHAKLHSAGHLIDLSFKKIVPAGLFSAPRASHIIGQSFVLYEGVIDSRENLVAELQEKVNDLIRQNLSFFVENLSDSQAKEMGVVSPDGKSPRYVFIENYRSDGFGCGGTHIASTKELVGLRIKKISHKKGLVRISYEIV